MYNDPNNPEKVLAKFKYPEEYGSARKLKARYYLSKILHMLFPKNIPDIYSAGKTEDIVLSLEKKNLDENNKELQKLWMSRSNSFSYLSQELAGEIHSDKRYIEFRDSLKEIGIGLNPSPTNLGYDEDKNLIYVDNDFDPWRLQKDGEVSFAFNREKLEEAIGHLDESDQARAVNYLKRIESLAEEESKEASSVGDEDSK